MPGPGNIRVIDAGDQLNLVAAGQNGRLEYTGATIGQNVAAGNAALNLDHPQIRDLRSSGSR